MQRNKISHSEAELFDKCKRQHMYSYGYGIMGKKESDALTRGIVGHALLRDYFLGLKDGSSVEVMRKDLLAKILPTLETFELYDPTDLAQSLIKLFMDYFKVNAERDESLEILEVEKEYRIPLGDDYEAHMFIDLILRRPGVPGIEVWDHKFIYDFSDDDVKDLLPQLPRYLGALRADGYNVTRAAYHELRYRVTNESKVDPSVRFRLSPIEISQKRVETTMLEWIDLAEEIREYRKLPIEDWSVKARRTANQMNCRSCSFRMICKEELNDRDINLTLTYDYQPKKMREANL